MLQSYKHRTQILNRMSKNEKKSPEFDTSQFTMLPMSQIELNEGQLEGLPTNPRGIKQKKFDKLKRNIETYPEMLVARSLLVYPMKNGKYIIIGGNMRFRAMSELHHEHAPVFIIPKDTPTERLQAYTILDNGDFGDWDWDILANEWDEQNLNDWGVDTPGGDLDIDDWFDNIDSEDTKPTKNNIVVSLPNELTDQRDEIVGIIENALSEYSGIKIK